MLIVPRVVIIGGMFVTETKNPFREPNKKPIAKEINIIIKMGIPGKYWLSKATLMPVRAMLESTDRSIPAERITMNCPKATIINIEESSIMSLKLARLKKRGDRILANIINPISKNTRLISRFFKM